MNKDGPVLIIEDDQDDMEILQGVFKKLNYSNKLIFLTSGKEAINYLNTSTEFPFMILSDINMPEMDGFALRDKIRRDEKLQAICIPYIFLTTASSLKVVKNAYGLSIQGFFVKQNSMKEIEKTISIIMEYWKRSAAPNNF